MFPTIYSIPFMDMLVPPACLSISIFRFSLCRLSVSCLIDRNLIWYWDAGSTGLEANLCRFQLSTVTLVRSFQRSSEIVTHLKLDDNDPLVGFTFSYADAYATAFQNHSLVSSEVYS